MTTEKQIIEALAGVLDPELHRSLVELGMVRDVRVQADEVSFTLALTVPECPLKDQIVAEARAAVLALDGVQEVQIDLTEMAPEEKQTIGLGGAGQAGTAERFNHIRHVVAVVSGKGGVGKSFVSALLAVALRRDGQTVGVLDADVTGPSIPKMFGLHGAPPMSPLGILPAQTQTGIKVMSINLLLPSEDEAVIWRGPLISSAIKQFWGEVVWGNLDWLVVDLPPGTSDAALTVMQSLPLSGVLLVSSPQDLAEMVVRKAARMARTMQVPLLGLVENMSYFVCPEGGRRYEVFGPSHGEEMARRLGVPFLGRLPLDPRIAALCDAGKAEEYPAEAFAPIAHQLQEAATEPRRSPMQPK
ncbi:MAG: Mrp/NBP35 family ATP-binding protein [bacterium]|nr:Mrp/NBP35 family ATP-binding protein [candidate division KSB1 bacterium]MDH7560949.1 Mrp/NBP35 family ATP-binding protein [bacterium]